MSVIQQEYSDNFRAKYWIMFLMMLALLFVWIPWLCDYGNEEIVARPPDWDVDKRKNLAIQRSAV